MTDQINSHITTAYTMLVFDFADPEGANKTQIEEHARCPIVELFDKQKSADRAKRFMKDDFKTALAVYFGQFQTTTGFDHKALKAKLDAHERVFLRHLGKERVQYIRLLISVAELLAENAQPRILKPRGLLFEATA